MRSPNNCELHKSSLGNFPVHFFNQKTLVSLMENLAKPASGQTSHTAHKSPHFQLACGA